MVRMDWGDDMAPFDSVTARLILLLAETGSIGRAAEREGIASSAVSRRVSDLESRLGVVLFDRSAHGVKLTNAGEAYAEGCRTVLRAIADLLSNTESSRTAGHCQLINSEFPYR